MWFALRCRRLWIATFAAVLLALAPAHAWAAQYFVDGSQAQTNYLPGGFVVLANTATGVNYWTTDPLFGGQSYSYAAIFDTGASGNVISYSEATGRNLLLTGQTYSDVGIGGTETFNVSQSTRLKLASVAVGFDGSDNLSNYPTSYGDYKFQVRQSDPNIDIGLGLANPMMVNIVGTPALNQNVMHVQTNGATFPWMMDQWGAVPVNYLQTDLLASAPSNLNASKGQLVLVPTSGGTSSALHVPLTYKNFVAPGAVVSTSTNPMIQGVQVTKNGIPSAAGNWLFDSGAAVTMVGRNLATAIGINLATDIPVATTSVMGVGGDTRTINGYLVDSLSVPESNGELVFRNIVVFVPNAGDLPADLPGIFGMNLINNSFSGLLPPTGDELVPIEVNPFTSVFSDWYVVPGAALLTGDINSDGTVNSNDLGLFLSHYNQTVPTGADGWSIGDFNGDNTVNSNDLGFLLTHYNQSSVATAVVPEPSTLVLLLGAAIVLCLYGTRSSLRFAGRKTRHTNPKRKRGQTVVDPSLALRVGIEP